MKNFITFLFALFLCANGVWGQRTVLSQAFHNLSNSESWVRMNSLPELTDPTLEDRVSDLETLLLMLMEG